MVTGESFLLFHATGGASCDPILAQVGTRLLPCSRFTAGRFTLFAGDPARVIAVPPNGLLIGRIFRRRGPPRAVTALNEAELEAMQQQPGQTLARDFWGNYLFALDAPDRAAVFRAPLGHLPCFVARIGPDRIVSGDLATMKRSGLVRPRIAWPGVARALYRRDLPSSSTAIEHVTELLPGVQRSWSGSDERDLPFWSPWEHVTAPVCRDPLEERLRREVHNATVALCDEFGTILLGASGGLDSSILACCLAEPTRGATLLTMATPSPDGDERRYARAIARSIDRPLIERFYDAASLDLGVAISAHLPRPTGWIHEAAYDAAVRAEAGRVGAGAFVSGNGGDNSFYNTMSARPVIDSLLARRGIRVTSQTLCDIGALTGAAYGRIVREAWRVWQRRRQPYFWAPAPSLLSPEVIAELECDSGSHDWLAPGMAPPGKVGHVAMLLRMQNHLGGFDPAWALPVLNPLATQPVIEFCLGVPSWSWIRGGVDRRPVRDAFRAALPPLVAERRSKGTPHDVVLKLLHTRASEVAERLLDGILVQHRIVSRSLLEPLLTGDALTEDPDPLVLMSLLNAEAWAQSIA